MVPSEVHEELACAAILRAGDQRICLADCQLDNDCPGAERCYAGACWPEPPRIMDLRDGGRAMPTDDIPQGLPPDAGRNGGSEATATMTDAGQRVTAMPIVPHSVDAAIDPFALDATVDFGTPVSAPAPRPTIEATTDAPDLRGTWLEQGGRWNTLQLDIGAGEDGAATSGSVTLVCSDCGPTGPIAPATDPDVGYPTEFDAQQQHLLRANLLPYYPYRIFDGQLDAEGFRFWFSAQDLWRRWCELQTSYPVEIDGRMQYTCVEDPIPDSLSVPPGSDANLVLCSADNPVCSCDADGCVANIFQNVHTVRLRWDGEALTGTWTSGSPADTLLVRFERVEEPSP